MDYYVGFQLLVPFPGISFLFVFVWNLNCEFFTATFIHNAHSLNTLGVNQKYNQFLAVGKQSKDISIQMGLKKTFDSWLSFRGLEL